MAAIHAPMSRADRMARLYQSLMGVCLFVRPPKFRRPVPSRVKK